MKQSIQISYLVPEQKTAWDDFVLQTPSASLYHLFSWKKLMERTFPHQTCYLCAEKEDQIVGVLPLVYVKSLIFGRFLVSMPFVNYGGIVAENNDVRTKLLDAAIELAGKHRMALELRHAESYELGLTRNQCKVSMILDLPESPDELWTSFRSKLRSQIKKPMKEGFEAHFGSKELLDDFYHVFAVNMRDLGSPVHGKKLFRNILDLFPNRAVICVVYAREVPVASGFLIGFRGRLEIPWASSLRSYNRFAPNMLLYWKTLEYACEHGFRKFDFGRSTPNGGTYRFKAQWGAEPKQLYWDCWAKNQGMTEAGNRISPAMARMVAVWKRLPVGLSKIMGPMVRKNIIA
ncbi:MAG: FemAB family PEP-CTERM system-associated protein [Deltaproteobacteria bacterium]|nr:FemAB family PEP-CTERM system-associated protein [Deltaproteobacteria bacterium]